MKVCSFCRQCYDDSVYSCVEESHGKLSETHDGDPGMIDGYELDFLLESGLGGDIYRAHQTASGGSCLIKILADAKEGERFLHETKLASTVFHPNLIDVYEAGSLETGECFMIYEDADGQTLRQFLDKSGVPQLLTAIQILRQASEALHALHLNGLMHRAINPANIILTTDPAGEPRVRIQNPDFGGVFEQSIISNKFMIDSALDSIKYFAPEQFSEAETSTQTDVYSLGIVFYEMLAGVPPFNGIKAAELIEKHRNQRPPDIRIDNFDLRMLITHSLTESLQKRPDLRQSSANVVARQMRHIEQLATHVSTPPPAGVVPPPTQKHAVAYATPVREIFSVQHSVVAITGDFSEPSTEVECEPALAPYRSADALSDAMPGEDRMKENVCSPPRRLRLKLRMKRIRHETARLANEVRANETLSIVEPAETNVAPEPVAPIGAPAVVAEPENIPTFRTPTLIEWEQPEDDIPSEADVLEVLSKERLTKLPVVDAMAERKADVSAIEWEYPTVDLPVATVAKSQPKEKMTEVSVLQAEPEEVTAVRTRSKPITIEWETYKAPEGSFRFMPSLPNEFEFYPTILGNAKKLEVVGLDRNDQIFSAYYGQSRRRFPARRSLMIGGGFVALMAAFLFGSDLVVDYIGTDGSSDSVAAAEETMRDAEKTVIVSPRRKKALKTFEKKLPKEVETSVRETKVVRIKKSPPLSRERSRSQNHAVKPSTLVISSANGKVKSRTESVKKSPSERSVSAPIASGTRPRIVKNPRP